MADNISIEIYTKFLEKAKLTKVDRETLKVTRGFSDAIIDKFKFISGRKQNRQIINDLRKEYDDPVLLKAGILEEVNNNLRPCSQLLDSRIIIPYLDNNEKVTLIRPHKLGLGNVPIQIYCQLLLKSKPEHIIITEGEFKAVALNQWDIPGIAVPGISSFGGKYFSNLVDLLKEFEVQKITVIFDNETKDNPRYKSYKEKPEDRWDTPYWAYIIAQRLLKENFKVKIGQLPKDWIENGKIDLDGALAQGKSKEDIISIRDNALSRTEFLNSLSEEAQKVVRRKIAMYFSSSPIWRNFNKYMIKRKKGDAAWDEQISNFIIDIKSSFFTPDGCKRHVQFANEFGEKSRTFVLEPAEMAGVGKFKEYCFSRGNYVWEGSGTDLQEVWKYELMRDTGDMIYMPEAIGEIEPGFWLFANVAIKEGKVYQPDSDGIFWIDGKGYKPQSLNIGPRGEEMEDAIPSLYTDPINIKEIAKTIKLSVGGYQAYIGLGWVVATIFSRVIFDEFKSFPFIFPHGKREAGKSTFMRWIMNFFGIETEGTSIAESSQNYIMRALSYYSSMGVWFDEYRNERRITDKDGYLRSAYNRQLSGKGVKSAFGTRAYKVKGTLAISGEELPRDSGLYTRCIPLYMSANRRERQNYDWLNRMNEKFSGFVFKLIKEYDQLKNDLLYNIKNLKSKLIEQDITDRTAENWAILAGAYVTTVEFDQGFIDWVLEACQEVREVAENEHILNQFWSDIAIMQSNNEIGLKELRVLYEGGKRLLAIWFPSVYDKWAVKFRQKTGKEPFDSASIHQYIKDEAYFKDYKSIRLDGKIRKCFVLDPEKGPGYLKEIRRFIRDDNV
ncbi:MAG: DUF3854 domain-containing protein [Halanaerobiales bacterium]|nr:DUF3854 domain-containing protein [Halanaerobiales bacterium]